MQYLHVTGTMYKVMVVHYFWHIFLPHFSIFITNYPSSKADSQENMLFETLHIKKIIFEIVTIDKAV